MVTITDPTQFPPPLRPCQMALPTSEGSLYEGEMPATVTFELTAWMPLKKEEGDEGYFDDGYAYEDNDDQEL